MFHSHVSRLRLKLTANMPCLMALMVCFSIALVNSNVSAQKKFAPRVLKTIAPEIDGRDVHSLPMVMPGLEVSKFDANYVPKPETLYGQTRNTVFHRDVFQHEFSFLPLRQLNVTASDLDGRIRDKNIWYLYYRVRNVGAYVNHKKVVDPKHGHVEMVAQYDPDDVDPNVMSTRFFGSFELRGWVQDTETGMYTEKSYSSVSSAEITRLIQMEEDPGRTLMNNVQMMQTRLERYPPESEEGGKWAVAIWYNVDPSLDFVSVKIGGLTNAYRMELNDDKSIKQNRKMLQLNFWRPGDGVAEAKDPIVYGIPLVDNDTQQIDIAKRYHLPGPVIQGELVDPGSLRTKLIFETDAELDPNEFDSAVAAQMQQGNIPESVLQAFSNAGYPLDEGASVESTVPFFEWVVKGKSNGEDIQVNVKLHPEFWEKKVTGGIRFIKRLDHLWTYE